LPRNAGCHSRIMFANVQRGAGRPSCRPDLVSR
jgi:hypothetical protein